MRFDEEGAYRAPPANWAILCCSLFVCAVYLIDKHGAIFPLRFADAHVLADAINDWRSGVDPYLAVHNPLHFVYPPLFLYAGAALARILPSHSGWPLYIGVEVLSVVALPALFWRGYFRQPWLSLPYMYLIFLAEPQFAWILALDSGNIACILYAAVFLTAALGLTSGRWVWFYVVLFVAASVKITFLLMLFLPLFCARRRVWASAGCALSVAAAGLMQRIFMPELYSDYRASIVRNVIGGNQYGYGSFGVPAALEYKYHHTVGKLPYLIAVLFPAAIFASLVLLRKRQGSRAADGLWITLVVVALTLANPRILHYDIYFGLAAAFILLVSAWKIRQGPMFLMAIWTVSFLLPWVAHSAQLRGSYEMLLLLAGYMAMYRKMWLYSGQAASDEQRQKASLAVDR